MTCQSDTPPPRPSSLGRLVCAQVQITNRHMQILKLPAAEIDTIGRSDTLSSCSVSCMCALRYLPAIFTSQCQLLVPPRVYIVDAFLGRVGVLCLHSALSLHSRISGRKGVGSGLLKASSSPARMRVEKAGDGSVWSDPAFWGPLYYNSNKEPPK